MSATHPLAGSVERWQDPSRSPQGQAPRCWRVRDWSTLHLVMERIPARGKSAAGGQQCFRCARRCPDAGFGICCASLRNSPCRASHPHRRRDVTPSPGHGLSWPWNDTWSRNALFTLYLHKCPPAFPPIPIRSHSPVRHEPSVKKFSRKVWICYYTTNCK